MAPASYDPPPPSPTADTTVNRPSPSAFYFTSAYNLRVTSYNALAGVVLSVRSRFLLNDGRVVDSADVHAPSSARAAGTSLIVTADGWLMGLEVFASTGTPITGQTYVIVEVVRGFEGAVVPVCTLLQGYVTASRRLSYPGSPIVDSLDGAGALRSITGTVPGAGVEISETVPTGARWEFLALRASLATSVTVINRGVCLAADDGAAVYWRSPNNVNQAASLTLAYQGAQGLTNGFGDNTTTVFLAMPFGLRLGAGHRLRTITSSIQVGDQWTAPQYLVLERLEPLT